MNSLIKISLASKKVILDIVSRTSRKQLIIASVITVTILSSGVFVLGASAKNNIAKEIAVAPVAKPTPKMIPTITPSPTVSTYHYIAPTQTVVPANEDVNSPTTQPQTSVESTPVPNNNTQTSTPTQNTSTVLIPVANQVTAPTAAPVDCSTVTNMVTSIKNQYTVTYDQAVIAENQVLASRGLTSQVGLGASLMSQVEQSVLAQESAAIVQFCASVTNTGCSCP
jgi:hypothetical protein